MIDSELVTILAIEIGSVNTRAIYLTRLPGSITISLMVSRQQPFNLHIRISMTACMRRSNWSRSIPEHLFWMKRVT